MKREFWFTFMGPLLGYMRRLLLLIPLCNKLSISKFSLPSLWIRFVLKLVKYSSFMYITDIGETVLIPAGVNLWVLLGDIGAFRCLSE